MSLLTATQIIDQAMQMAGNTRIQAWSLVQLNKVLREVYRKYEWPFLMLSDETLSTTASQAYTTYSGLGTTLWKPKVIQIRSGTSLFPVTPLKGGLPTYFADTSRLAGTGRPSKYALDRANSRLYWADSIPTAAETISLFYQREESDVELGDTPKLVTHTKNGEEYLIKRMELEIRGIYMHETVEGTALAGLVREKENAMLADRLEDEDLTPTEWGNARYV